MNLKNLIEQITLDLLNEVKYEKLENGGEYVEASDGSKRWYLNGEFHREDGPAYVHPNGSKQWWLNGELHREDGPAIENFDGTEVWYLNGERHREDGPALEYPNGTKGMNFSISLLF